MGRGRSRSSTWIPHPGGDSAGSFFGAVWKLLGGVIQLFTATGHGPLQVRTGVAYGSFDNLRASVNVLGSVGALGYNLDYSHFQVDGYREHSAAKNDSFNGKLNYSFNDANRLALIAMSSPARMRRTRWA